MSKDLMPREPVPQPAEPAAVASRAALTLVSHPLCPYVQRAVIALVEKAVPFERIDIDLARKPAWFLAISPLGKTPVLRVGKRAIFESAVIVEYLEETGPNPLHPADALTRAEHRAWIEVASAALADIAGLYSAPDDFALGAKSAALAAKLRSLERHLEVEPAGAAGRGGPYFAGGRFSLVDAAFAPVFRYFDVLDAIDDFAGLSATPSVQAWRRALAERPSVRCAVASDYAARLRAFLAGRGSQLSRRMAALHDADPAR